MGLFDWLFRKTAQPAPSAQKRYQYPTGNIELGMRVERGEFLMAVIADIKPRWAPGNEYLWDDYDPESLVDTPEKARYTVNALLFGRVTAYRALRASGRDVRGQDPFEFAKLVPEVFTQLRERFPGVYAEGARAPLRLEIQPLKLSPGDPGIPHDNEAEPDASAEGGRDTGSS
jgi:hypothetical protein